MRDVDGGGTGADGKVFSACATDPDRASEAHMTNLVL